MQVVNALPSMDAKYQGVNNTATVSIWFEQVLTKSSFQYCEHQHRHKIGEGLENKKNRKNQENIAKNR